MPFFDLRICALNNLPTSVSQTSWSENPGNPAQKVTLYPADLSRRSYALNQPPCCDDWGLDITFWRPNFWHPGPSKLDPTFSAWRAPLLCALLLWHVIELWRLQQMTKWYQPLMNQFPTFQICSKSRVRNLQGPWSWKPKDLNLWSSICFSYAPFGSKGVLSQDPRKRSVQTLCHPGLIQQGSHLYIYI